MTTHTIHQQNNEQTTQTMENKKHTEPELEVEDDDVGLAASCLTFNCAANAANRLSPSLSESRDFSLPAMNASVNVNLLNARKQRVVVYRAAWADLLQPNRLRDRLKTTAANTTLIARHEQWRTHEQSMNLAKLARQPDFLFGGIGHYRQCVEARRTLPAHVTPATTHQ